MAKMKTPILLAIDQEGADRRIEEFHDNIIKIGKLSSVNLRLDDPGINRIHAVIEVTAEDEAQIIDMGSSKGTRVNGKRIHKTKISSGDEILLGSTNITIFIGEAAVSQARLGNFDVGGAGAAAAAPAAAVGPAADPAISGNPGSTLGFDGSLTADAVANVVGGGGGGGGVDVDVQMDNLLDSLDGGSLGESTQVTRNPLMDQQQAQHHPDDTAPVSAEAAAAVQEASAQLAAQQEAQAQAAAAAQAQAEAEAQAAAAAAAAQAQAEAEAHAAAQAQAQAQAAAAAQAQAEAEAQAAAAQQAQYQQPMQPQATAAQPGFDPAYQQAQYQQQPMQQMAPAAAGFATPSGAYNQMAPQGGFQQGFPQQQPMQVQQAPVPMQSAPMQHAQQPKIGMPANFNEARYADSQEVLEIRVMWGDTVLDHAHLYDPKQITIGDAKRNTFQVSSDDLPPELANSYTLVEADGDRLLVNFTDNMSGTVQIKEQNFTLDQIKQSAKVQQTARGYQFALPAQSRVNLVIGQLTFIISFVPAPKRIPPGVLNQMDHHLARAMGASFLIHGIVILFMLFSDEAPQGLGDDFFKQSNRFAQLIIRPDEPEKKKKKKDDGGGAKAKGKEGKMGRKKSKVVPNRRAGQKKKNPDGTAPIDMQKTEKELLDKIGKKGMLGLLGGGGNKSYGAILTAKGFGGDDADAVGGWHGAKVGDSGGSGGLGLRGGGGGGGGFSGTSVGIGKLGTYGRGGGKGGRGWGRGRFRGKRKRSVEVSTGPPVIFGALDKEIIRRVINQHRAQIKYCYERELIKHPKLQGKIKVFFQIEGNGRVSTSRVTQTTMNNDRVEQCIVRRVRFWRFPAPKGGGIVHVNYPFFFKPS